MTDDIVARLRAVLHNDRSVELMNREAANEIERLRKERDEARCEVCGFHHLTGFLAGDYAISRGWNYFNDERKWPKFPQSVTDFDKFLKGQDKIFLEMNDRLRKENEELRKELAESERLLDEYQREAADRTRWENINE